MLYRISFIILFLFQYQLQAEENNRTGRLNARLKTSLNAYSFNEPLTNGSMKVEELLEYCAKTGFDAVDITAYYFPGYPKVPTDEYLYSIKRKAFQLGLEISGTGVRNDFVHPEQAIRDSSVQLVKEWIIAAEKMGIPVIRIFAGHTVYQGFNNDEVLKHLLEATQECVEFGKAHGVVVALQNHWDYIKTAKQVTHIMNQINSEWFGLILDIGSYRSADPYAEIEATIPYAVSWQLKEKMYIDEVEKNTDLIKIMKLIQKSHYRGYVPIETLGKGNPKDKVEKFHKEVTSKVINKINNNK